MHGNYIDHMVQAELHEAAHTGSAAHKFAESYDGGT
jgi:hypothetical protein